MLRQATAPIFLLAILLGGSSTLASCVGVTTAASSPSVERTECSRHDVQVPEGRGAVYRVGPGQQFEAIGDVAWSRLKAGDTVLIHHRDEPYREKILISGHGTSEQWIRVLGVPGPKGELPIISGDGAVTSNNMRHRWVDPKIIQHLGVVQIAVNAEVDGAGSRLPPSYIEIANLKIQDGFSAYRFRAENGEWTRYSGFAACLYTRSVDHLVIRNNVLTNCGQGFYNWTGDGSTNEWWAATQKKTILTGNYIYNNGNPGSYLEHQVYTESDGVVIEYNRFGPQRDGALGSQIKDRSVGTVIRYNAIVQSPRGWIIDLVEPEESWRAVGSLPSYRHAFVYGNSIVVKGVHHPNFIHWNEDHQAGRGRATLKDGKLLFYNNTIAIFAARADPAPLNIFNATWGGYECPQADLPGTIDVRNNVIAVVPKSPRDRLPPIRLGYCGKERIHLGVNWISPGVFHRGVLVGADKTISPGNNDPGFTSADDLRLRSDSPALSVGGGLAPEVTANALGQTLHPSQRFIDTNRLGPRLVVGQSTDLGAY